MSAQKPTQKQFKWGAQWCTIVDYIADKPRRTAWHRAYDRFSERTPYDQRDFNQDEEMDDQFEDVSDAEFVVSEAEADHEKRQNAEFLAQVAADDEADHNSASPAKVQQTSLQKTYFSAASGANSSTAWHQARKASATGGVSRYSPFYTFYQIF